MREETKIVSFDYEKETKLHYQDPRVAESYHQNFTSGYSLRRLRSKWIAYRERKIIRDYLLSIPHSKILDIPTGTGKLAPVLKDVANTVVACDVSNEMISIAKKEFDRINFDRVRFVCAGVEEIGTTLNEERFDAVVCLRLLHRVPNHLKASFLSKLSVLSPNLIVSIVVDSKWDAFRRGLARRLFGVKHHDLRETLLTRKAFNALIDREFNVVSEKNVSRLLSGGRIYLLCANPALKT